MSSKINANNSVDGVSISADSSGILEIQTKSITAITIDGSQNVTIPFKQTGTDSVARTVDAKLKEELSVLDFGADPTGVADSSTAIQNAINAAAVGQTILIPSGTYRLLTTINIIRNGVVLKGECCTYKWTSLIYGATLVWAGASGGTCINVGINTTIAGTQIEGLEIVNSATGISNGLVLNTSLSSYFNKLKFVNFNGAAIKLTTYGDSYTGLNYVHSCRFEHILASQSTGNAGYGLHLTRINSGPDKQAADNTFYCCGINTGNDHAIFLEYSDNNDFLSCDFDSIAGKSVYISANSYANNFMGLYSGASGVYAEKPTLSWYYNMIYGLRVSGGTFPDPVLQESSTSLVPQGNLFWSSDKGDNVTNKLHLLRPEWSSIGYDSLGNTNLDIKNNRAGNTNIYTNGAIGLSIAYVNFAVNYIQIQHAFSTAAPVIRAAGSDTDIDLALYAKGNGIITNNSKTQITTTASIGTTSPEAQSTLYLNKNITGSVDSYGVKNWGTVQSDVTSGARYFSTYAQTQSTAFNLSAVYHYSAAQGTLGSGGAVVTSQYGYLAAASLTGATTNYGFVGNLVASGTARYNFYAGGTAPNYFAGDMQFGKTVTAIGTTGAVTIDKTCGTANFATYTTSATLVVTNNLVTANSIIIATIGTSGTGMTTISAVAGAGSFTLTALGTTSATTRINFLVIN